MEYIEQGKLIEKEQSQQSRTCDHKIKTENINETIYRYCNSCGMLAHQDGSYAYCCHSKWCRCSQ